MNLAFDCKLVTEDGEEYYGQGFGAAGEKVAELVFNTAMAGYQEIVSDPSYADQALVMTYPLIGNYGLAAEDYESRRPFLSGLIVRDYNDLPSNFRQTGALSALLEEYGIPGLSGVDTRRLARSIRDKGSRRGLITPAQTPLPQALAKIAAAALPHDQVARVSCRKPWQAKTANPCCHVVAVDCGVKLNIIRSLNRRGCNVTIVPWDTGAERILALGPDGLLISNGPGDPEDAGPVISLVRQCRGRLPMFGICLGHQIICLAYGGQTYKLKFGHRGGNHPVRNLELDKIEITSQNHSYAVSAPSLAGSGLAVTHRNLLDDTVEGAACRGERVFSVQYHPESAPGPEDSAYLFDQFVSAMKEGNHHA